MIYLGESRDNVVSGMFHQYIISLFSLRYTNKQDQLNAWLSNVFVQIPSLKET